MVFDDSTSARHPAKIAARLNASDRVDMVAPNGAGI